MAPISLTELVILGGKMYNYHSRYMNYGIRINTTNKKRRVIKSESKGFYTPNNWNISVRSGQCFGLVQTYSKYFLIEYDL